jgi:chromosome segregation ATPase
MKRIFVVALAAAGVATVVTAIRTQLMSMELKDIQVARDVEYTEQYDHDGVRDRNQAHQELTIRQLRRDLDSCREFLIEKHVELEGEIDDGLLHLSDRINDLTTDVQVLETSDYNDVDSMQKLQKSQDILARRVDLISGELGRVQDNALALEGLLNRYAGDSSYHDSQLEVHEAVAQDHEESLEALIDKDATQQSEIALLRLRVNLIQTVVEEMAKRITDATDRIARVQATQSRAEANADIALSFEEERMLRDEE